MEDDKRALEEQEDYDPTPYCHSCYAMTQAKCNCGAIAENN